MARLDRQHLGGASSLLQSPRRQGGGPDHAITATLRPVLRDAAGLYSSEEAAVPPAIGEAEQRAAEECSFVAVGRRVQLRNTHLLEASGRGGVGAGRGGASDGGGGLWTTDSSRGEAKMSCREISSFAAERSLKMESAAACVGACSTLDISATRPSASPKTSWMAPVATRAIRIP